MRDQPHFSAYLALASVCVFWGTTYLGIRIAVESLPPSVLMCTRYLLSGGALLIFCRLAGARLPRGRELWITAACGVMTIGVGTGLLAVVEQWAPSGLSSLFVTASPFWLAGVEAAMPGGEPLHAPTIGALLVGAAGVAVLVSGGDPLAIQPGGPGLLAAFFILQLGSVFWALGSIVQRRVVSPTHPFVSAAVQQLAAGIVYTGPALLAGGHAHWTPRAIGATLYLAVFGGFVGYSSYVFAMQRLPVAVASIYTYINPLVAVWLGWLFYREAFSAREAIGMAIIFAGVWLVKRAQKRSRPAG
ncbi:MAG: EamA family transporter [Bryobacterales bacterium]|nr:EamA family transporter [Bryobacterales bacterium]MBV9397193.1 EamA family transporter [Bryobacterales bacterium]